MMDLSLLISEQATLLHVISNLATYILHIKQHTYTFKFKCSSQYLTQLNLATHEKTRMWWECTNDHILSVASIIFNISHVKRYHDRTDYKEECLLENHGVHGLCSSCKNRSHLFLTLSLSLSLWRICSCQLYLRSIGMQLIYIQGLKGRFDRWKDK